MDKVLRGLAACICRCARRSRAVALVPDRAWSAAGASVRVRGGRCQRLVLVVPPQKLFSVEHGVVPRAPTDATRCNCGALGAACAEPILILRYMNLYYLITVVNKIIVFLK